MYPFLFRLGRDLKAFGPTTHNRDFTHLTSIRPIDMYNRFYSHHE
jgi:hypothetical protein